MATLLWRFVGAVALVALLGTAPAQAQAPIKIGASLSLTGTYAKPGTYQKEGYELCADELNAKGGLLGRKVEFVMYDDQSSTQTGAASLREAHHRRQGGRGDGALLVSGSRSPWRASARSTRRSSSRRWPRPRRSSGRGASTSSWSSRPPRCISKGSSTWPPSAGSRPSPSSTRTRCSRRPPPPARWRWRRRGACRSCSRRPTPRATPISRRSW